MIIYGKSIEQYRADRADSQGITDFIGGVLAPFAQQGLSSLAGALFGQEEE